MNILTIIDSLYQGLLATTWLEFVAVILGILSVFFARNENIWTYPTGIVNVLIYVYLCFSAGLFADMGINVFYFIMSVYGWYNWSRRDENSRHVPVSRLTTWQWVYNVALILGFFGLLWFILDNYTPSTVPMFDSFTTALFIIGMWLMARKKIENWLAWIAGDILVIPLFAYKGLVFTGFQYVVFTALAISGYIEWKKKLKNS
ncbi:MAG TPA: nicotinamide riboside transporter PnuC [Bacteroidales bacterium]|nr:nicotinamide riboside transporter PnuC [Bacteroidales bacterium]